MDERKFLPLTNRRISCRYKFGQEKAQHVHITFLFQVLSLSFEQNLISKMGFFFLLEHQFYIIGVLLNAMTQITDSFEVRKNTKKRL